MLDRPNYRVRETRRLLDYIVYSADAAGCCLSLFSLRFFCCASRTIHRYSASAWRSSATSVPWICFFCSSPQDNTLCGGPLRSGVDGRFSLFLLAFRSIRSTDIVPRSCYLLAIVLPRTHLLIQVLESALIRSGCERMCHLCPADRKASGVFGSPAAAVSEPLLCCLRRRWLC